MFNKTATARLGTGFLNTLHNAKSARAGILAAGLSSSMATASPIQIDNRPALSTGAGAVVNSPMHITININASQGQSAIDIATAVRQELAKLEQQRQVKMRSSLRDWD
ncbi:hypothetical protein GVX76_07655 [[Haemophilus] felis]|nr:hypothetical protein [[Haemophilus] felis]